MVASRQYVHIRLCVLIGLGAVLLPTLAAESARGLFQAKPTGPAAPPVAATPPVVVPSHPGELSDTNLVFVGRWDRGDPMAAHSYWGGAYVRAKFTGTTIAFRGRVATGGETLLVSIDGEPPRETKSLDRKDLALGVHTLLIGSPGQNSEIEFRGITLSPGAATLRCRPGR